MLDSETFQKIYDQYKNLILKVAYDMLGDYHLAQDICQDTFMKLYGYQDHIDVTRVKSWLLVVAGNQVRDYLKKGGKHKEILDEEGILMDLQVHENCIDAHLRKLGARDLQTRMLDALREKNSNWYEVLILVEYLEVPRKVVAKQRGIALSTVDLQLNSAKKWLIKNFGKEFEEL